MFICIHVNEEMFAASFWKQLMSNFYNSYDLVSTSAVDCLQRLLS